MTCHYLESLFTFNCKQSTASNLIDSRNADTQFVLICLANFIVKRFGEKH